MSNGTIIKLFSDALMTTLTIAAPILGTSLVVGLIISIIQTTTSIQEQTLTFVPKIVITFLVIIFLIGWIVTTLTTYTESLWDFAFTVTE
jgi:flagellar biosynthesis protein FliQ